MKQGRAFRYVKTETIETGIVKAVLGFEFLEIRKGEDGIPEGKMIAILSEQCQWHY
jgi:hypothetical protein